MKRTCLTFKLIAGFCLMMPTIYSCKKSSSTPSETYNISYSSQGKKVTYTFKTEAAFTSGNTSCGLNASSSDGSSSIVITVLSNAALSTATTYTDSSSVSGADFEINSSGKILGVTSYANTPDVKLNFTTFTPTYVKGTFSGNISATDGGASVLISNGTFYLPVIQ